jgi:hypothetical protein
MQALMIGLTVAYDKVEFRKPLSKSPIRELTKRPHQEQKASPHLPHRVGKDAELPRRS